MSAAKSIKRIFNRVASHTATAILAGGLAITTGITTYGGLETYHSAVPVVSDYNATTAAELKVENMARDILREQAKLDFTATSIKKAQANLGTSTGSVKTQMNELNDAREQYDRDMEAQMKRLTDYRREIWFNPALSEAKADALYRKLFFAAQEKNLGTINNFLAPMTDALSFRDETIGKPRAISEVSDRDVENTVAVARATDNAHDGKEIFGGIGAGLLEGLISAALIAAGHRGRRRENEEAERDEEKREQDARNAEAARRESLRAAAREVAARNNAPQPPPAPVEQEQPAPGKKNAAGFSV